MDLLNIRELARSKNIDDIFTYGDYMAKVNISSNKSKDGKLVLVSAITPTTSGEGKTTVSIGIVDSLNKLNKNCCGVLREPSLGPVFGLKGGAIGGGMSRVEPSNEINLHFTGDFHAITSANNLIAAAIDNHIFNGNKLEIDRVVFKRCIDMNDRSLRDKFNITAASEVMSIFTFSKDIDDLRDRVNNIIIGYKKNNDPVFLKELNVDGAVLALLKDAIKPNIVQTLENNLVFIHGGPFANVSVGTSSIISINEALKNFDYVITESGFASDLGGIKFLDVLSRSNDIKPNLVVLVATIKAIKEHGYENILEHIKIMKSFNMNSVIAINKFEDDKVEDINNLKLFLERNNIKYAVTTSYADGSDGSIDLSKIILENLNDNELILPYQLEDDIEVKISKIMNILNCNKINYSDKSKNVIEVIRNNKFDYPICISKTQYSISDDKNKKGVPKDYEVNVDDIEIYGGAKMIVVKLNDIITLPGLNKNPNYLNIDVIDRKIVGIK